MIQNQKPAPTDWLIDGGEIGALIRSMDWSSTSLGSLESWPQSLRTTVSLCLASSLPISIIWGAQRIQIYNQSYSKICGGGQAIGQDFRKCWALAWPSLEDAFNRAWGGETTTLENQQTLLDYDGYLEETVLTFSFSPIRDETGGIGGVFHTVSQTSSPILRGQRTQTLEGNHHHTSAIARLEREIAQREQELRSTTEQSRNHVSKILESITDAFVFVDERWRYTYVNEQASSILHRSREELLGQVLWDVFPDAVGTLSDRELHRAVSEQVAVVYEEFSEILKRWFKVHAYPSPNGLAIYFQDISESKEVQRHLEEQKLFLQNLTNNVPALLWTAQPDGTMDFVSQPWIDYTGMDLATIRQQGWRELIHADDFAETLERWDEAARIERPYEMTHRVRTADGGYRWCISRAVLTPSGWVGSAVDIELQKQAEQELQHTLHTLQTLEERLRLALEASGLGMWYWDLKTDTLTWTDQCKTLFGLSADTEISYAVFLEALHPDDRERTQEAVTRCIYGREPYDIEYRTLWPDGTLRWISARGCCTYSTDEELICMIGVALDLTERRYAEDKLHERAAELTALNTALAQATRILQERNQELDQFVYIVSHDLKAPLRAISNLSQWIEDDLAEQLPEENQQQMQLLRDRVFRMERLIDGLLDYSRVSRTETATETVDVSQLLTEIVDSLAPPNGFILSIAPNLPTLTTHRLPLSQVFANLLSNAIKHHGGSEGRIDILIAEGGDHYQFSVVDDGQGIPPEHHGRVFAIFQTVGSNESKTNTGIGLAIVKKIVERHGGRIELESGEGRGTTFRFTWPKSVLVEKK